MYPINHSTPLFTPFDTELLSAQALRLMTNAMSAEDRLFIARRLSFVSLNDREQLITQALRLISDAMSAEDRIYIISKLSFMSKEERELLLDQTLPLIKEETSPKDRRVIIEGKLRILQRKYRFRISNREIIESPVQIILDIYETLVRSSIQLSLYSIQYTDSMVIDDGGVLRSFVAALMNSFCNSSHGLFIKTELGVIPTFDPHESFSVSVEEQEKCFKVIGKFFSAALQQCNSIVIGQHFNPIVFEMIFHLTVQDFANQDFLKVFDKILKIYLVKGFKMEEELAENLIRNDITDELREIYCLNSKEEFIKEYELDQKIKGVFIIAKSIYDSLGKTEWDTLQGDSADNLQAKIQGTICKGKVKDSLVMDTIDKANEISLQYLKKWITETNFQLLEKFVEAICGIKRLPPNTQLNITRMSGVDKLPVFYICFFRIELSEYSCYQVFKEKLEKSLDYCLAGCGFQMG